MKKRNLSFAIAMSIIVGAASSLSAADPSALDVGGKIGIEGGYPSMLTGSYRFSKDFEASVLAGNYYVPEVAVGANALFRLATVMIGDDPFPVSFGPEGLLSVGGPELRLDALGVIRIENTLRPAPFNVYLQAGLGVEIFPLVRITGTAGFGLRLVFGHPALKIEK